MLLMMMERGMAKAEDKDSIYTFLSKHSSNTANPVTIPYSKELPLWLKSIAS
jgi:hypothetical protein